MANATAHHYIHLSKSILHTVLAQRNVLPKRVFKDEQEFEAFFQGVEELLIDATERPIQRPVNQNTQKESYSVKKQCAFKNTVISSSRNYISSLEKNSKSWQNS